MTPFTVECTTCRRKLLVRNDALIGQILPCPKCSSMVLIERPAGDPSASTSASAATQPNTAPAEPMFSSLDDVDRLLNASDTRADTVPEGMVAGEAAESASATASDPAIHRRPHEMLISEEARLMRRWLMIGSIASAAAIVLIVAVVLSLPDRRTVANAPSKGSADNAPATTRPTTADVAAETSSESDSPPTNSDDSASEGEGTAASSAEPSVEPDSENKTPADTTGESPVEAAANPMDPMSDEPATAIAAAREAPADASATPPAVGGTDPKPGTPAPRTGTSGALARSREALRDFDSLLLDAPFESSAAVEDSPLDLIPSPGKPYDLATAMPKPVTRPVNVEAQLAIRIPELDFREGHLAGFLRFASDFTNAPVTVDADALYRLGIAPTAPIELHATNEDLQKSLAGALTPLGLEHIVRSGQILIRPAAADVPVEQQYEVFDLLAGNPDEAKALEDVMTSLVMPGLWQSGEGNPKLSIQNGKLHVRAIPAAQWEVMVFTQRLRLARGLPLQGDLPEQVRGLELRFTPALPKLAQTVTISHALPVPLTTVLDELSAASGMHFWINWQTLSEVGWTRESLARLEVTEQPIATALQDLLGPMELSFRVIDGSTLEITSAAAAYRTPETAFFPVAELLGTQGPQELLERVRSAIGDSVSFGRVAGGFRFDATSKTLVVTAPQYQLAAIARMLAR